MLISEKGLIACLKDAYKRSGYTIMESGGCAIIYTGTWFIRIPFADISNDVMSLIVKHAGLDVFRGEALHIMKDTDPQTVLQTVVGEDVNNWIQAAETWAVTRVPILVKGLQLYQIHYGPSSCYGTDPFVLQLVANTSDQYRAVVMDDSRIAWTSAESEEHVIVKAIRPIGAPGFAPNDQKVWSALESVNLGPSE